jgi:hypothetical protein
MSSFFSSNFTRAAFERVVVSLEELATFVENSTLEQIATARAQNARTVTVLIEYPENWRNRDNEIAMNQILSEMIHRFEPVEVPWGSLSGWEAMCEQDLMEQGLHYIYKFRFTLTL